MKKARGRVSVKHPKYLGAFLSTRFAAFSCRRGSGLRFTPNLQSHRSAVRVCGALGSRLAVGNGPCLTGDRFVRSEEHTSELQSLMRISYAVFCLKKKKQNRLVGVNIE